MILTIITRYLVREILKSSIATILVLFVIFMSSVLGRILVDIAAGAIPKNLLLLALLSQSINILSVLIPIGFFFGIVFAFGRLYKDHEIVAMQACGFAYSRFYHAVIITLIPLLILCAYTTIWLNAELFNSLNQGVSKAAESYSLSQFKAGQFIRNGAGENAFYMESISTDHLEMKNIVISQKSAGKTIFETAESGRLSLDENTNEAFLVVGPGRRYEGAIGDQNFSVITFDRHGILLENEKKSAQYSHDAEEKTPLQLWRSGKLEDSIELHWRISIPVTMLILALLAVPLSHISPRQGQYGKVGYALLVCLLYLNLIALTSAQLEVGVIPMQINFWWVHVIFITLTIALLGRRNALPRVAEKKSGL